MPTLFAVHCQSGYSGLKLDYPGEHSFILLVYNKIRSMNFLSDPDFIEKLYPSVQVHIF